jgi:hypothetical protein
MVIMDPQKLRDRAAECRSFSLDGDDVHLKAALILLATDFEHEARRIEAAAVIKPQRVSAMAS